MAHTLGAKIRVYLVNLFPHINGLIGTLGFTHIAVDAFVGDI
jgi:hypothetical protein